MVKYLSSTPKDDNYIMPAEFDSHDGCWMLWPHRPDIWRNKGSNAKQVFAELAHTIAQFERVTVGVNREYFEEARNMLSWQIRVVEFSYDDVWIRDSGPTFVVNHGRQLRAVKWKFNAWGGLYASWYLDDLIASKVAEIERVNVYRPNITLEGGAIHVDGKGTLITTRECLTNPNRNPSLSLPMIEKILEDYLGVRKIIWINKGVYLDETGGHIDNLCCFIREGEVVLTWTEDKDDPQYDISHEAYNILMSETDALGQRLKIHKIHQPHPLFITQEESDTIEPILGTIARNPGDRLPASYINFYPANGAIIVPFFHDAHDLPALQILQSLLPERKIIGVYSREILLGGGNIHCVIQQQPSRRMLHE